jgi:hypothetical protein
VLSHDRVSRSGACSRDPLEIEGLFFKQAIKHPPGEGAVAAAALECEVQDSPHCLLVITLPKSTEAQKAEKKTTVKSG